MFHHGSYKFLSSAVLSLPHVDGSHIATFVLLEVLPEPNWKALPPTSYLLVVNTHLLGNPSLQIEQYAT
jgi:hypothetical protein